MQMMYAAHGGVSYMYVMCVCVCVIVSELHVSKSKFFKRLWAGPAKQDMK